MFYPTLFKDDLFDDFFNFPSFRDMDRIDRKLYGKHTNGLMKTDVHENEGNYALDIDLPGFKKDQINVKLEDGYMTISAAKDHDQEKKDKHGKIIRQERYEGAMQRSFYVGEGVKTEDVKAKYEDGVLKLDIPKKELNLPGNNTIAIEG